MPDRYTLEMRTAFASNTGGPFTHAWDSVIVPETGVVRQVWAGAVSLASNARVNSVDIYNQADAPAFGSNTATSILTTPIRLVNDRDMVAGIPSEPGSLVDAGDVLQLRTYADTIAATPAFLGLTATVEIERT